MRIQRLSAVLLTLIVLLAGCPMPAPPQPPSDGGACTCPLVGLPDLPHNDLPHNDLAGSALTKTSALLGTLARAPLTSMAFSTSGSVWPALADPASQKVMEYLVGCALNGPETSNGSGAPAGPVQTVTYANPAYPTDQTAKPQITVDGELGLCGAGSPAGDWSAGPATPECQELVSACLLARVNALGRRVIISVRGEPTLRFPLRDRVLVEDQYRENNGTPIASFAACSGTAVPPDCGWQPHYVGRCVAGDQVTIRTDVATDCDKQLRVCTGLYGCNTAGQPAPYYGGSKIGDDGAACPGLSFTCPTPPDGGTSTAPDWPVHAGGKKYAYYSVMFNPQVPGTLDPSTVTLRATTGDYPATEAEVFTWREGASTGTSSPRTRPPSSTSMRASATSGTTRPRT